MRHLDISANSAFVFFFGLDVLENFSFQTILQKSSLLHDTSLCFERWNEGFSNFYHKIDHHLQREKSALAEYSIDLHHRIDWTGAKVVARQQGWRRRLFEEAFVTHQRLDTALNKCELSVPAVYKKLAWRDLFTLKMPCCEASENLFFSFLFNKYF